MKVLHVLASLGPLRGGPSFVLRNMATGLAERGIQVDVATTDDNGPERLNVPLSLPVSEEGATYWYFRRQTKFYTCSHAMAKWLWKNVANYDLIHIHAVFTFPSSVAAWTAQAKGVPYIVRPLGILNQWGLKNRHPLLKKLSLCAIEGNILKRASLIHYTSAGERMEAESAGIRTESTIIANPVDLDLGGKQRYAGLFRQLYPMFRNRPLVAFLSRIDEKKGIDLLIRAFAVLRERMPDAALVIAGSGNPKLVESLKRQASEVGLDEHLVWPGFLQGDQKGALLADADVFVLPSYSENFGVAVVEALAYQIPIVISDQVGIHDQISSYGAGLVVPCDEHALADALALLLSQPRQCEDLRRNADRLLRDCFSTSSIVDSLIHTYHSILRVGTTAELKRTVGDLPVQR
jgi:glycosyltransferase involved in cell wall biosynthesis